MPPGRGPSRRDDHLRSGARQGPEDSSPGEKDREPCICGVEVCVMQGRVVPFAYWSASGKKGGICRISGRCHLPTGVHQARREAFAGYLGHRSGLARIATGKEQAPTPPGLSFCLRGYLQSLLHAVFADQVPRPGAGAQVCVQPPSDRCAYHGGPSAQVSLAMHACQILTLREKPSPILGDQAC